MGWSESSVLIDLGSVSRGGGVAKNRSAPFADHRPPLAPSPEVTTFRGPFGGTKGHRGRMTHSWALCSNGATSF